jgi:predicted ferric reductase
LTYYAAALCGLLAIFILFHLGRVLAQKFRFASKAPRLAAPFLYASRTTRHLLIRKVKFLPSAGHALLAFVYVAINIVIMFTNIDTSMAWHSNLAARTGWMAIGNLVLVVFLSLKNTPLGYLTAWSYERINVLHQIAGYVLTSIVIIHGCTYSSYFGGMGNIARMTVHEEIFGITAGFCVLTLALAGAIVRRFWYELFYVIHVLFFMSAVIFIALHQPDVGKGIIIATCFAAALWATDRIIRFTRLVVHSINNNATIHPLPNGGTRIILKKAPRGATSGSHCFVWIPGIRFGEMHPFTISSMEPMEFVVASYDGFTRDLHKYAAEHPGAVLKASVEGHYGTFPDPMAFDKIVLIAGGSGGSFTFGVALNLLKKLTAESKQQVTFLWMVKETGTLSWFSNHISALRSGHNTTIALHVTRSSQANLPSLTIPEPIPESKEIAAATEAITMEPPTRPRAASTSSVTSSEPAAAPGSGEKEIEKESGETTATRTAPKVKTTGIEDPEKSAMVDSSVPSTPVQEHEVAASIHGVPIKHSRPNVANVIRDVVESTPKDQRVLVVSCGPACLMNEVRNTAAALIRPDGPGVELHCESFGW